MVRTRRAIYIFGSFGMVAIALIADCRLVGDDSEVWKELPSS